MPLFLYYHRHPIPPTIAGLETYFQRDRIVLPTAHLAGGGVPGDIAESGAVPSKNAEASPGALVSRFPSIPGNTVDSNAAVCKLLSRPRPAWPVATPPSPSPARGHASFPRPLPLSPHNRPGDETHAAP